MYINGCLELDGRIVIDGCHHSLAVLLVYFDVFAETLRGQILDDGCLKAAEARRSWSFVHDLLNLLELQSIKALLKHEYNFVHFSHLWSRFDILASSQFGALRHLIHRGRIILARLCNLVLLSCLLKSFKIKLHEVLRDRNPFELFAAEWFDYLGFSQRFELLFVKKRGHGRRLCVHRQLIFVFL